MAADSTRVIARGLPGVQIDPPNVVLVGLPGVGKTYIGRAAARILNWPFIDFDTEIEHREHSSIPRIFAGEGEKYFRSLERALTAEVAKCRKTVMSAGGVPWHRQDGSELLQEPL